MASPEDFRAFVFTDIEGSTELLNQLDDTYHRARSKHDKLLRKLAEKYRGEVVKSLGDGFFLAFGRTRDALSFAKQLQVKLDVVAWPKPLMDRLKDLPDYSERGVLGLRIRIGVHAGVYDERPIAEETGTADYFGMAVNIAARVMGRAAGGEILITEMARETGKTGLKNASVEDFGPVKLKGADKDYRIYRLVPDTLSARSFPRPTVNVPTSDQQLDIEALTEELRSKVKRKQSSGSKGKREVATTLHFRRRHPDVVDQKPEDIFTNIVGVEFLGETIWEYEARVGSYRDVRSQLERHAYEGGRGWSLQRGKLVTLGPARESVWQTVAETRDGRSSTLDEFSSREGGSKVLAELVKSTVEMAVAAEGLKFRSKVGYYFPASEDLSSYELPYARHHTESDMTVFGVNARSLESEGKPYYKHFACRFEVTHLPNRIGLVLLPSYQYTSDGHQEHRNSETLRSGLRRMEGSKALLSLLFVWSYFVREVLMGKAPWVRKDLFAKRFPLNGHRRAYPLKTTPILHAPVPVAVADERIKRPDSLELAWMDGDASVLHF